MYSSSCGIGRDGPGRAVESNFDDYRITRMLESPRRIDLHFVPSTTPPSGPGEPPVPPLAAALAAALYAATEQRWRRQPFAVYGANASA